MKKIKRILPFIIPVMFICVLFGCGKNEKGAKDTIRLRWVTYGGSVPADIKEVIAAANEYSAEKIGITVDLELQPSDKLNLIMASGELYDMIFTSEWLNSFDNNVSKDLFYDITDLVQEETPALYETIGKYWEAAQVNGRIYGVPTLKDMGTEMMFRLNADYFEGEKGMEIPESMDFADIEPYLAAYKEDYPHKYPLAMDKGGIPGFTNFMERIVSTYIFLPYSQEGSPKVLPVWDCEELMNRYRLLHKWYQLGYIQPDASAVETSETDKTIPVRFGVAWRGYQGYSNPNDWGFQVKTSLYGGPYISRSTEQGALLAICSGCSEEHARAALRYIELLNTDRTFRDILAYGIEGKHFNYLDNGTVLRTETGRNRYQLVLYPTGSVVNASVESASEAFQADPDQWEKVYKGYEDYGIYSSAYGFVYDKTRMEDIIAAVTAIYTNYRTDLSTGTSDPDKVIPKMRSEMEEAGIGELLEDIQQQLDEYLEETGHS